MGMGIDIGVRVSVKREHLGSWSNLEWRRLESESRWDIRFFLWKIGMD